MLVQKSLNIISKKNKFFNYKFVSAEEADYIVMTNRVTWNGDFISCFDMYEGDNVYDVKRNSLTLSVIRKLSN